MIVTTGVSVIVYNMFTIVPLFRNAVACLALYLNMKHEKNISLNSDVSHIKLLIY